jgi:CRP-like cAMP-binding protein
MGEGGASIYDRYMCCGRSLESIAPSAAARDAAQIEELRAVLQRLVNVTQSQHTSSAIPRLVQGELLCLATEADLLLCPKKTLLFLQGDFGSSYFVVLCGSVELYVEKRKEKCVCFR